MLDSKNQSGHWKFHARECLLKLQINPLCVFLPEVSNLQGEMQTSRSASILLGDIAVNIRTIIKPKPKSGAFIVTESGTARVVPSALLRNPRVKADVAQMRIIFNRHTAKKAAAQE